MREHGVEGTGLAQLIERSCSARRSIYQHFPGGKAELIEASTRAAGRWMQRSIREAGSSLDASALVAETVRQISENLIATDYAIGCPVAAAASAESREVRDAAGEAFAGWVHEIEPVLVREGHSRRESRALAGFAISALEGAVLRARAARSVEPLREAGAQLSVLLAR